MPLFETIRQVLTPPISYPMVTLFPVGRSAMTLD